MGLWLWLSVYWGIGAILGVTMLRYDFLEYEDNEDDGTHGMIVHFCRIQNNRYPMGRLTAMIDIPQNLPIFWRGRDMYEI